MHPFLSSKKRSTAVLIISFFVLSALVYGQAVMKSEFVRWDDGMLVYENPVIREITPRSVGRIFSMYDPELYIPVTFLSYQIDYQIGGIAPLQYHLTNFLFHTLNALLVCWFAMLFFRGSSFAPLRMTARSLWLGIFCGAVFLLHPLHTEAIMWVSGRKDLLSTFFFLLTLIYWLRWKALRSAQGDNRRWYLMAVGFFTLALLSKIMAVTLPLILLFLDWREGRTSGAPLRRWIQEMIVEKIPFFALAIVFGLIGIGGKTGVVASSSTWEKIIMAGKSSLFYVQKIVWPDFYSLLYAYRDTVTITSPDFYIPMIIWIVIIGIVTGVAMLRPYGWIRDVIFGLGFFLVTLSPTFLNFTKGGDLDVYFASDRYAYVPSIGIFIAIIAAATMVIRKEMVAAVAACIILTGLGYRSYRQSEIWRTTYTLLTNVLVHYPDSHVAHNNIANSYRLEGRLDDAIAEFQKALAIRPHPKVYANLGAVYRKQGKITEALDTYDKALALNPNSKDAYMGRGLVRFAEHNYTAAEADFRRAIEIDQKYLEAHTNLGATYMAEQKLDDAIREYRIALVINPFFPEAHFNLGVALMQKNQLDEAMEAFAMAVGEAPAFIPARINYALLLYKAGDRDAAADQFREVLKIDPKNSAASRALQQMGEM